MPVQLLRALYVVVLETFLLFIIDNLSKNSKSINACRKTKDAVNVYSQISDTISLLVKKSAEQKKNYQSTARLYAKNTADIEKEIAINSKYKQKLLSLAETVPTCWPTIL